MIEVMDHPTDTRRVIIRMTGAEHMFLNLTRNDAVELARVVMAHWVAPDDERTAA